MAVATDILNIWSHPAEEVAARIAAVEEAARGRFVLGPGVSHGPIVPQYAKPYSAMVAYSTRSTRPPRPCSPESGSGRCSARRR